VDVAALDRFDITREVQRLGIQGRPQLGIGQLRPAGLDGVAQGLAGGVECGPRLLALIRLHRTQRTTGQRQFALLAQEGRFQHCKVGQRLGGGHHLPPGVGNACRSVLRGLVGHRTIIAAARTEAESVLRFGAGAPRRTRPPGSASRRHR